MRTIALYTTDTMADWEYAHLTAQITVAERMKPGRFRLLLVGDGVGTVHSLGGLPLSPAADLDELVPLARADGLAALVIPGADTYTTQPHDRLAGIVRTILGYATPVAAICGATFLLARAGLLDDRAHTSNAPSFLLASDYEGAAHYRHAPVVTDRGVTTASGIHAVPFTAEVMRASGLLPPSIIDSWERLYLTGREQDYQALMDAADAWQKS